MDNRLAAATAFLQAVELLDREIMAIQELTKRIEERVDELERRAAYQAGLSTAHGERLRRIEDNME